MTDEEKVGQLFFRLASSQEEDSLKEMMEKYHLGGCRYSAMPGATVLEQNREQVLPATLCPEIMTDLLRNKLGFNGMVVTDASHMVAMTNRMKRKDMLPVIGISVNKPTMLADCPMLRTDINVLRQQ